jgi:hypothetical protein
MRYAVRYLKNYPSPSMKELLAYLDNCLERSHDQFSSSSSLGWSRSSQNATSLRGCDRLTRPTASAPATVTVTVAVAVAATATIAPSHFRPTPRASHLPSQPRIDPLLFSLTLARILSRLVRRFPSPNSIHHHLPTFLSSSLFFYIYITSHTVLLLPP